MVSVVPYMLTSSGASSGCRSYQPASRAGSSASPARTTTRSGASRRTSGRSPSAVSSAEKAVGVWHRTVTRSRASSARRSAGTRPVRCGTITSRPPVSSAPNISHTETSKAQEWKRAQMSSGPKPNRWAVEVSRRTTLAWVVTTPLGVPAEPDVWMMYAQSRGSGRPPRSVSVTGLGAAWSRSRCVRSSSSRTTGTPPGPPASAGSPSASSHTVSTAAGATSRSRKATRSAGYAGSTGR